MLQANNPALGGYMLSGFQFKSKGIQSWKLQVVAGQQPGAWGLYIYKCKQAREKRSNSSKGLGEKIPTHFKTSRQKEPALTSRQEKSAMTSRQEEPALTSRQAKPASTTRQRLHRQLGKIYNDNPATSTSTTRQSLHRQLGKG